MYCVNLLKGNHASQNPPFVCGFGLVLGTRNIMSKFGRQEEREENSDVMPVTAALMHLVTGLLAHLVSSGSQPAAPAAPAQLPSPASQSPGPGTRASPLQRVPASLACFPHYQDCRLL